MLGFVWKIIKWSVGLLLLAWILSMVMNARTTTMTTPSNAKPSGKKTKKLLEKKEKDKKKRMLRKQGIRNINDLMKSDRHLNRPKKFPKKEKTPEEIRTAVGIPPGPPPIVRIEDAPLWIRKLAFPNMKHE